MFENKINLRLQDCFLLIALFSIVFWVQHALFISWDVSWHILGAKRMLHGAGYMSGIFDDNPPMVFWFYIPVVLATQYFSISIFTAQIIFVELITLCSFILCNIFLKRLYSQEKPWKLHAIRYGILMSLMLFQIHEFGQREMLLTTFCLPYIILMGVRMHPTPDQFFKSSLLIFVGLWLAIGISLNPLYGLIVIALEIQLWITTKKIMLWRPDIILFFFMCFIYLLSIYLWYPNYYKEIIPAVLTFSPGFDVTWQALVFYNMYVIIFEITTLIFIVVYRTSTDRSWILTLWLSATISFFIYLINKKMWYYHIFPVVFFTLLLVIALLLREKSVAEKNKTISIIRYWSITVFLSYLLVFMFVIESGMYIDYYKMDHSARSTTRQLVEFFNHQPLQHGTLYTFATSLDPIFPLVSYIHLRYLPMGPDCWTIPSIIKNKVFKITSGWQLKLINKYRQQFITQTVFDFQTKKPDYVLVDNHKNKVYLAMIPFDYIDFLSQNAAFRMLWKNYKFDTSIGHYAIYQRKS